MILISILCCLRSSDRAGYGQAVCWYWLICDTRLKAIAFLFCAQDSGEKEHLEGLPGERVLARVSERSLDL